MQMFRPLILITVLLLGTALSPIVSALEIPELTVAQQKSLEDGGHVIQVWRDRTRDDGAMDVFGAIDIQAPAATIWKIMLDCEQALKIVKDMRSCEILETAPDGSWDIREQKIKVGPLLPKSISIFRSDYIEPHSIKISLQGGNMKVQDGVWKLDPVPSGKVRVMYRAAVRSKFTVPNGLIKRAMRKDVPEILRKMRSEAEDQAPQLP